jgi:hypothetical protein
MLLRMHKMKGAGLLCGAFRRINFYSSMDCPFRLDTMTIVKQGPLRMHNEVTP